MNRIDNLFLNLEGEIASNVQIGGIGSGDMTAGVSGKIVDGGIGSGELNVKDAGEAVDYQGHHDKGDHVDEN